MLPLFTFQLDEHWLFVPPGVGLVSDSTCQSLADPGLTRLLVPNRITHSTSGHYITKTPLAYG